MEATGQIRGKVLTATRKTYNVAVAADEQAGKKIIRCTLRGRVVVDDSEYDAVKVGDNVMISLIDGDDDQGLIESIFPRTSEMARSISSRAYQRHIIAVNIDQLLIVFSTRKPRFKSGFLDRYLVIAAKNKLPALICINKIDLYSPKHFHQYKQYYDALGYPVLFTSATENEGLAALQERLSGKVTALVGQSGVGKSSLIKAIEPDLDIRIGEVSERTRKGMHTTTASELVALSDDGFLMDTPGIRELGFWEIYKRDLGQYFVDIVALAPSCQFADCIHDREPGCAVKAAVASGDFLEERYENYLNILDSLKTAHYE